MQSGRTLRSTARRYSISALICCVLFFALGFAFVPLAGIQNDEAIFANGIYDLADVSYTVELFHRKLPLMLMPYLGAFKSWLYAPILAIWRPSPYAVRIPVLLLVAVTIWLLFLLTRRVAGDRAALIATALLSTDPMFLLTTCFDWGPVALQHFFLLAGLVLLVAGARGRWPWSLPIAFFAFGLGVWDKVVFLWALAALALSFAIVFPRISLACLNVKNLALAAGSLCLGSLPLIAYNIHQPLGTLHSNVWVRDSFRNQFRYLRATFEGSVLFGWLASADPGPHPPTNSGVLLDISARLSGAFHHPYQTWLWPAFVTALLITAILSFTRRREAPGDFPKQKPILAATLALAVFWMLIVFPYNGGSTVHHTILLWPLPQFIIGLAFAGISSRFRRLGGLAVSLAVSGVLLGNVLVVNEYYEQLATNGPGLQWTDASYALTGAVERLSPRHVVLTDWGFSNTIRLLDQGKLDLVDLSFLLARRRPFPAGDEAVLRYWLAQPATVFVAHTAGNEIFPHVNANLEAFLQQNSYEKQVVNAVEDRSGRPTFEVFACRKQSALPPSER